MSDEKLAVLISSGTLGLVIVTLVMVAVVIRGVRRLEGKFDAHLKPPAVGAPPPDRGTR